VSLLEKAYAKLHGSYFALDCGSVSDALVDLTGGVVNKVKLDNSQGQELVESGALWTRMLLYCSWGYIMAVVKKVMPASDGATGPGGLLLNHVYSVIDCRLLADGSRLVHIHNPWPAGDWHGAWSAGAREWSHPGVHQDTTPYLPLSAPLQMSDTAGSTVMLYSSVCAADVPVPRVLKELVAMPSSGHSVDETHLTLWSYQATNRMWGFLCRHQGASTRCGAYV
jgi:hypothetical protein